MKQIKVGAHHNVEDFRPYKINFKDKGSDADNRKHALKLAIKREGEWYGWFEEDADFDGKGKEVNAAIDGMFENDQTHLIIEGNQLSNHNLGLVIWCEQEDDRWNVGFGIGVSENLDSPVTIDDTDKYQNKWITFTK